MERNQLLLFFIRVVLVDYDRKERLEVRKLVFNELHHLLELGSDLNRVLTHLIQISVPVNTQDWVLIGTDHIRVIDQPDYRPQQIISPSHRLDLLILQDANQCV